MIPRCPRCGQWPPAGPPVQCPACGHREYLNPRPTGGVILRRGTDFLAVRRARQPQAGQWDLPSGFCDGWEHPAQAALREAREELGLIVALDAFVGMFLGGYRHDGDLLPVLDCFWLAHPVGGALRLDPAEATGYRWFPLADPPPMAFGTMDRALRAARGLLD